MIVFTKPQYLGITKKFPLPKGNNKHNDALRQNFRHLGEC